MNNESLNLLNDINRAIIKFRGIYSMWSNTHGISYNELLVFYTIREQVFCTQKQICDSYLLPRQTINHVIAGLRESGLLQYSKEHSSGWEKAFVLSAKGQDYAKPFLASLDDVESRALAKMGTDKLHTLTALLLEYDQALNCALEEQRKHGI